MSGMTLRFRRVALAAMLFAGSLCLGVFSLRAAPLSEEDRLRLAMWEAGEAAIRGGQQACEVLTRTTGPLQPEDPRLPAIELLGHLRFEEGVRPLVKQIELSLGATDCAGNPRSIPEESPAARALVRIGRKASHACAHALSGDPSEQQKQLLMWVIHECENPVSAHAIFTEHAILAWNADALTSHIRARRQYARYEAARANEAAAE